MTRIVWNVIKDLLNVQKSIQLGGVKMRARALRYLRNRRRYEEYLDTGRVETEEPVYNTRYPIQWAAAHYGWGDDTDDEAGPQPGDYEDGMEEYGESEEDDSDHAVEPSTPAPGASSSMGPPASTPASGSAGGKGKAGGKAGPTFERLRDPPSVDEFDENRDG